MSVHLINMIIKSFLFLYTNTNPANYKDSIDKDVYTNHKRNILNKAQKHVEICFFMRNNKFIRKIIPLRSIL